MALEDVAVDYEGFQDVARPARSIATPAIQWVVLLSSTGIELKVLLGEGTPNTTEGYGGWETIDRPRDLPIVEWRSQPAFRQELPLLLNGWKRGNSIEGQIAKLEAMARPVNGREPPTVKVYFPGDKPRTWRMDWVIEAIDWGDADRLASGERMRQWVTLSLLQRVSQEDLISPAKQRQKNKATGTATVGDMTVTSSIWSATSTFG